MSRGPRRLAAPADTADDLLSPFDLMRAPQLAALVVLETALHVARLAMLAAHAELLDGEDAPRDVDPGAELAARLLDRAHDVYAVSRAYRAAIAPTDAARDDDIHF